MAHSRRFPMLYVCFTSSLGMPGKGKPRKWKVDGSGQFVQAKEHSYTEAAFHVEVLAPFDPTDEGG